MGKSLGNAYTLHDIKDKGFDLLDLRYLYLGANYRDKLNFSWESLKAAQTALGRLKSQVSGLGSQVSGGTSQSEEAQGYKKRFFVIFPFPTLFNAQPPAMQRFGVLYFLYNALSILKSTSSYNAWSDAAIF